MADTVTPTLHRKSGGVVLHTISYYKFIKSVCLFLTGAGFFRLLNPAAAQKFTALIGSFAVVQNHRIFRAAMKKFTGLSAEQLRMFGVGAFFFAVLYGIEGIGLWFRKQWAEVLTLFATSLLLPVEIVECVKKLSVSHGAMLLINIAVTVYLYALIRPEVFRAPGRKQRSP